MKTIISLIIIALFLVGCTPVEQQVVEKDINSFDKCVEAGYPVMESYPRKCSANGWTFVENIEEAVE